MPITDVVINSVFAHNLIIAVGCKQVLGAITSVAACEIPAPMKAHMMVYMHGFSPDDN